MHQLLTDSAVALGMRCPSCGVELGDFPTSPADPIYCRHCEYSIHWEQDCWDACVDKTYPRDFARQWILWEAGKLGDPNVIYGVRPEDRFQELLDATGLSREQLESMRILEVGFGHGRLLKELQKWCPTAYGLDLARPLPSAGLRSGSAIFGNLLSIPFISGQFDLVICRGVIHHTPDTRKSFDCIAQQVAANGVLFLSGHYEPAIKSSLLLRRILPSSWLYPESLRLGLAGALSVLRAAMETVQTRKLDFQAFKKAYLHYKLDIFDVITPRWSSEYGPDDVKAWFASQGFCVERKAPGEYIGLKKSCPDEPAV